MSANTGETQLPLSEVGLRETVTPYLRAAWRAMGDDVPAWVFFWNACLLLNTALYLLVSLARAPRPRQWPTRWRGRGCTSPP